MSNDDKTATSNGQAEQADGDGPEAAAATEPESPDSEETGQSLAASEAMAAGDALEDLEPDQPDTTMPVAPDPASEKDGLSRPLALLALIIALGAAAGSGFLFWQYRQFYVALDGADAAAQTALEQVRSGQRGLKDELQDQLQSVVADQQAAQRQLAEQRAEVQALPPRLVELEERLLALQGVSADAQRRWRRAEAEYLLSVANVELTLSGRFEGAIAALELADSKLRELGNPGFTPVREAIASELQGLRSVALPDVEGLSLTVGSLAGRADTLPMGSGPPQSFQRLTREPEDVEPGLARVWLSFKSALKGMISIEQREEALNRQLSGEQENLVRRNLALQLGTARLALLREQGEPYRQGLATARDLLQRYFDNTDPQVVGALALVDELILVDVQPPRPDISGSLILLRQLSSQEGATR
jgi:uncharacterized protein HemX